MNKDVCRAQLNLLPTGVSRVAFQLALHIFTEATVELSLTMVIIDHGRRALFRAGQSARDSATAVCVLLSDWSELQKARSPMKD